MGETGVSQVVNFYNNQSIFITGASGFMGKVLLEKLLYTCPDISNIYILMRGKRGQSVQDRVRDLLKSPVFKRLSSRSEELLSKVSAVSGDITSPRLGLSDDDVRMLQEKVSIVFHVAATVKFDMDLKSAVKINVTATKQLAKLCKSFQHLQSMVHVSTAYCNCDRPELQEVVSRLDVEPENLVDAFNWMDDDLVKHITPKLVGNRPNTYTYTKALAEQVLIEEASDLPISIMRPSIVTAAWQEPLPGWVDNLNGPTGAIAAVSKGLLATVVGDGGKIADFIPVDFAINMMITLAWHTAKHREEEIKVYNCTSGELNPLYWSQVHTGIVNSLRKYPMESPIWYPRISFTTNAWWYYLQVCWRTYVPAYLLDAASAMLGKQQLMVKRMFRVSRAMKMLEFFTCQDWTFHSANMASLWTSLSAGDKARFDFDIRQIQWDRYLEQYCLGVRKFVLHEEPSSIPSCQSNLVKLYWLRVVTRSAMILILLRLIAVRASSATNAIIRTTMRFLLHILHFLSNTMSAIL